MAYNNLTSRTDASALMPEEVSNSMLGRVRQASAALSRFRSVPVGRAQVRFPILSALPVAYWVTGDTGLKQTTEVDWNNKFLNVEEVAALVPIPDNVVADAEVNVWDEVMPDMVEAVGRTIDSAIFFGANAPGSFPANIATAATSATNSVTEGATAAQGGFFGDIDNVIGTVETDGFDVDGFVASRSARGRFRSSRNTLGDRQDANRLAGGLDDLDGLPITYPMRGLWPAVGAAGTNIRLFAGDWSQFVIGLRQDVTFDFSNEAILQDNTGAIIYNSFQQDLTIMRVKIRLGWQVANLLNYDQPTEANRYPVGVLKY